MANTTINATSPGDVFINVVDTTNQSSFLFDTGVAQSAFNSTGSYTFNFASDPNYQAFASAAGSNDAIDYSVISATKTTTSPNTATLLFTTNAIPSTVAGASISQAQGNVASFVTPVNLVASTTTNSVYLDPTTQATWGQSNAEFAFDANLGLQYTQAGTGDSALPGTALNFFSESSNALRSATTPATLSQEAGTWNYASGVAVYSAGAPVPLPTPILLLLSALGLMSVVTRRAKSA